MKKICFLLILFICVSSFAMAEDGETEAEAETRIGLSLGLEFGVVGANKPNGAEKTGPYIFFPLIGYANSFFSS